MKKLKTINVWGVWLVIALLNLGCGEEGGLKGTLKISITDAPVDADQVKSVNLVITNIEGYQNGNWKAFKNFEQPVGVNLLAYTGGKSILLIDQYTSPGEFSSMKLSLNMANRNSSLIISPQSNIVFKNGSSAPLYMPEGQAPEVVLEKGMGIYSRGITDITLDFDLRKSIRINEKGEYILDPYVRFVETKKSGHIKAALVNSAVPNRVVVYAYKRGTFSGNEATQTGDRVAFLNSTTSTYISAKQFSLGFLEEGVYDLIFVKHLETGVTMEVLGRYNEVKVSADEIISIDVDLSQLSPS